MEKVKVSHDVAKALDNLRTKLGNEEIFNFHKDKLREVGWRSKLYGPLNKVSLEAMYEILKWGYEANTDRPIPKTPHQMGSFDENRNKLLAIYDSIGKVEPVTKQQPTVEGLQAELDYELASLHHAINEGDEVEVARSKRRLAEIHREMEGAL